MKKFLLATAATAALLALTPTANADLLNLTILDDATTVNSSSSGTGSITFNGTSTHFSQIGVIGTGVPLVASPGLGLVTVTVSTSPTFTGTHSITIDLVQTVLAMFPGGTVTGTFTSNALTGTPGPVTEQVLINGSVVETQMFAAGTTNGSNIIVANAGAQPAGFTDEEKIFATFTGPGQALQASIQLVANVPEPASLALFGTALLGLGLLGRRRNRGSKTDAV